MIEDIDPNGDPISVTVQIADMIKRFTGRDTYDVVLIDSRAGLSELAAPTILGLGENLIDFDPVQAPSQLNAAFYEQAYRPFLDGIDSIIAASGMDPQESEGE